VFLPGFWECFTKCTYHLTVFLLDNKKGDETIKKPLKLKT